MVNLTDEDKKKFKSEIRNCNPVEVLAVSKFIESSPLQLSDKKFCFGHIGKRCERLLRNVAEYQSWEGGEERMKEDCIKNICKIGQGKECCRYLACGPNGFECTKHTSIGRLLDSRVESGTLNAQGNNSFGVPSTARGTLGKAIHMFG